jgi:hypothetical protein
MIRRHNIPRSCDSLVAAAAPRLLQGRRAAPGARLPSFG